jgi:hypothetical protein
MERGNLSTKKGVVCVTISERKERILRFVNEIEKDKEEYER